MGSSIGGTRYRIQFANGDAGGASPPVPSLTSSVRSPTRWMPVREARPQFNLSRMTLPKPAACRPMEPAITASGSFGNDPHGR